MKFKTLLLSSSALGVALALLIPARTDAFTTLGGTLDTSLRDVRLFNNFTDPTANDNTTPDPNFPGYVGAELAVWKGIAEWGSTLFGDGSGDPHQPNGIGSGGANFDAVWAGNATSAGGTDDNIVSEIPGSSGGVIVFTETPTTDGWRILFYRDTWILHDGPNTGIGSGVNFDIQGCVTRQYGHAVGLGASSVTGSTMFPSFTGNGVLARSLESDDIAGVQFLYGVAAANKPRITGASIVSGVVTISGMNFDPVGNEIWFTPASPTVDTADPVVKSGLVPSSSGGTQIQVALPAGAGKGNVLVKLSGSGPASLSNAWPFESQPCQPSSQFCVAAPNSASPSGATTSNSGSPSVASNNLQLVVTGCPPNKTGLFFYGQNIINPIVFGNGFRCLGGPFFRLPTTTSNLFGDVNFPLDLNNLPVGGQISVGQTWGFQLWYRDPAAGGANFNASDGIAILFCP